MKKSRLIIITLFLLATIVGSISLPQVALAKGETYVFTGTGSDTNPDSETYGLGGQSITASGGAFKSSTVFTKGSPSSISPDENKIDGYGAYYIASSFNLKDDAAVYNPSCKNAPAIIALKSERATNGILYPASTSTCGQAIGADTTNIGTDNKDLELSSDIQVAPNTVEVGNLAYYNALKDSLAPVKNAYYQSLENPPCSSQGCNDSVWIEMVGSCWASARITAADTQREIARAIALGSSVQPYDINAGTKIAFASCLSKKLGGVIDPGSIVQEMANIVTTDVNQAGSSAASAALTSQGLFGGSQETTCAIDGVGWIVCPVVVFLAEVSDASFVFLADGFLRTDPKLFETNNPTYATWSIMRSFANVAFVIAFLIIIFSQLSGAGITNYGVKKLLPRLVIAAILVNTSYFICQAAVDLSNILGFSIKGLFETIERTAIGTSGVSASPWATDEGFAGVAGGVIAITTGGGLIYLLLSTLVPVLIAAVVGLIMILLILVARQVLIILLIVISPLAFVAFLLPNTEQWFKKWRQALTAMLLLFPIVAVVYGASSLAAGILSFTFSGGVNGDTKNWFGQIIAAAVLVLPLFVIPGLLKKALDGVGNVGAMMNNLSSKMSGAASKAGGSAFNNSRLGQFRQYRKDQWDKNRSLTQAGGYKGKNPFYRVGSAINKRINDSPVSGSFGNKQAAAGILLAENQEADERKAAAARLRSVKPDRDALRALASGRSANGVDASKDPAIRSAAIEAMVASNDVKGMQTLWDESKTWTGPSGDKLRSTFADSLQASGSRPAYYGQGAIADLRVGGVGSHTLNSTQIIEKAIHDDAYSAAKIAAGDKDELAAVADVASSSATLSVQDKQKLVDNAHTALTDPDLSRTIGKNLGHVQDIRSNVPPRSPIT